MRASCRSFALLLLAAGLAGCVSTSKRGDAVGSRTGSQSSVATEPIVMSVPGDPTLTSIVWFRVGSQNDPPGKEGLAFLTGALLAEGSTTKRSYEQILEELYPMAASYGVRVDKEMTTLTGRSHRDTADRFFELYTDAFLHPAFDEDDFERLRSNTLNYLEKTLRYASDEELAKATLHAAIFDGTRYEHPPQGTVSGVKAITLQDVRDFYRRSYTRGNAVVALGGATSSELVSRLERSVAGLPAESPDAAPLPNLHPVDGIDLVLVSKPGADASISFGFPIDVHRGERDFYALWIANSWLGEHRNSSSHLYEVIREKRGLNYGDYSYIEAFPEGGARQMPPTNVSRRQQVFEVWIRTLPNTQAVFALKAAMRELDDLIRNGMTKEEFELTRSFLSKYILHFAPTPSERLGYAVDDRFYGIGDEGHLAKFRQTMRELTLADVNAAIKRHLRTDDLTIAIVTGEPDMIRSALTSTSPTSIQYASAKSQAIMTEDVEIGAFRIPVHANRVRVIPVDRMFE